MYDKEKELGADDPHLYIEGEKVPPEDFVSFCTRYRIQRDDSEPLVPESDMNSAFALMNAGLAYLIRHELSTDTPATPALRERLLRDLRSCRLSIMTYLEDDDD